MKSLNKAKNPIDKDYIVGIDLVYFGIAFGIAYCIALIFAIWYFGIEGETGTNQSSTATVIVSAAEYDTIGFDFEQVQQCGLGGRIAVFKHRQTGVYYLVDRSDGGMCVILDADGKLYTGDD